MNTIFIELTLKICIKGSCFGQNSDEVSFFCEIAVATFHRRNFKK